MEHCDPESVFVCSDSEEDIQHVREQSLALKSILLQIPNSPFIGIPIKTKQDKTNTRFMVYKENMHRMKALNSIEYGEDIKKLWTYPRAL